MRDISRRNVLPAVAFPFVAASTVRGANDRVDIGFIGVGTRARWLLRREDFGTARVVAMADISPASLAETLRYQPEGQAWRPYHDYRRMFESEKLDAVFVETPTHARALICMHAMQAGLDVYAEKPLSLTVEEGQILTKAARHYRRVLQVGTQQRSIPVNVFASNLVETGKIGRIRKVIVCNFFAPRRWTPKPEQPIPAGLDWDQWCNQTELRPYHADLHRGWYNYWDFDGGGQSWGVTGWGTHSLDQVQAALGTSLTGPVKLLLGEENRVTLVYASGAEVSLEQPRIDDHQQLGAIFQGTDGEIQILRGSFKTNRPELHQGAPDPTKEGPGESTPHVRNFVECIRSRQLPNADVEIGHRSTVVCHLVNICREAGQSSLAWDPMIERFHGPGADEANARLSRVRRKGYELPSVGETL
ncbi:MAG: Gfo/Idh/MocA family oxidoreductase [Acidobacteria bacterium]|nr:Gfo/Idh/MocA family oxidoreductase [Acidobacteriota bacterium]